MSLTTRARELYDNRRLAAKWVLAMRHMLERRIHVLDPNAPAPGWGAKDQPEPPTFPRVYFTDWPVLMREWDV